MIGLLASVLLASAAQENVQDEPVRFAPFVVEMKVDFEQGSRTVRGCRIATTNDPDRHWLINACENVVQPAFLQALGVPQAPRGPLIVILSLTTSGASDAPAEPAGDLIFRSGARFSLAADGSFADCAPTASTGFGGAINLCDAAFPRNPRPFLAGPANRRGQLVLSAYQTQ